MFPCLTQKKNVLRHEIWVKNICLEILHDQEGAKGRLVVIVCAIRHEKDMKTWVKGRGKKARSDLLKKMKKLK
jgi:hypothetical protein